MIVINSSHGPVIAAAAGYRFNPNGDMSVCRVEDGRLLGGAVFSDYTGKSIAVHVAGLTKNWMSHDLIWTTCSYPFEQLKCELILAGIRSSNRKALAYTQRMGFNFHARIRDVYPDGDMLIYRMRREECRWLDLKPRTIRRMADGPLQI